MVGNYSNLGKIATIEACWEFVNMMKLCDKTKAFGFNAELKECACVPTGEQVVLHDKPDANLYLATVTTEWVATEYGKEHQNNQAQAR